MDFTGSCFNVNSGEKSIHSLYFGTPISLDEENGMKHTNLHSLIKII